MVHLHYRFYCAGSFFLTFNYPMVFIRKTKESGYPIFVLGVKPAGFFYVICLWLFARRFCHNAWAKPNLFYLHPKFAATRKMGKNSYRPKVAYLRGSRGTCRLLLQ